RVEDRRRAAVLSHEPRHPEGRGGSDDSLGLHRAQREGAARGVRRRDEPADPAPDGGLGRMTTTQLETSKRPVASWAELCKPGGAAEPAWAVEQRKRAAKIAETLPFPDRSQELWRRTDFGSLAFDTLDLDGATETGRGGRELPLDKVSG